MNSVDEILSKLFYSKYSEDQLKLNIYQHKSIESCQPCEGTGFDSREELSCYHKREYSTYHDTCKDCAGSGRVTKTTTKLQFDANYPYRDAVMSVESTVPYPDDPIGTPSVQTISTYVYFERKDSKKII